MKIIFLTRSLDYGGAERQLATLATGLKHRGHEVIVAVFYDGPLKAELQEARVLVKLLGKRGRWDLVSFAARLIRLVREQRPDLVHGYLCVPNVVCTLLSPFYPSTRIAWGVRASHMDLGRYDWTAGATYCLQRWLSRFADLIIANSHAGLEYAAAQGFPRDRMIVIPNGIDTDRFHSDPEARLRVRAEWQIAAREKLVGLVGRLDPMKDHPTFLKAASLLASRDDSVRFVCVGDGPPDYRQELVAAGVKLSLADRLIWAGHRTDMCAVYNALDAAVSASYGEGFPNTVAEAMACGVPCIVTDVGDAALIVGDMGEVVPAKNAEALRAALQKVLTIEGTGTALTRQRILSNFSVAQLVTNTESVLLGLNSKRSAA